jgi:hypothetical protein
MSKATLLRRLEKLEVTREANEIPRRAFIVQAVNPDGSIDAPFESEETREATMLIMGRPRNRYTDDLGRKWVRDPDGSDLFHRVD